MYLFGRALPIPAESGYPKKGPKITGGQTKAAKGEYADDIYFTGGTYGVVSAPAMMWQSGLCRFNSSTDAAYCALLWS